MGRRHLNVSFGACTLLPGRCQLSNSLISPILPRTSFPASNMSGRGPPRIEGMTSLKVDNLTYRTTCDDLRRVFEKYGDVGDVYIPKDRFSRESRGFAFVRFYDRRDGEDAMHAMDGRMMDGRELRVQLARYGRPDDPPSRRHGGRSSRRRRSRSRSRSRSRDDRRSRRDDSDRRSKRKSRSRSHSRSESRDRSRSHSKSPHDNGDARDSTKDDHEAEGDRDNDRRSRDREEREEDNGREDRRSNDRDRNSNDRDAET